MSTCRIAETIDGLRYRAKTAAGAWRVLTNGDAVENGETVEVISGGPQFGTTVCWLQNRVSGEWSNAVAITLDLTNGTSHTRRDLVSVTGDATDSTVTVTLTSDKGHQSLKEAHLAQVYAEEQRGIVFTWQGNMLTGVISEIASDQSPQPGGYLESSDARLVANRHQFAELGVMPLVGQVVEVGGDRFFLGEIAVSDTIYTLDLRKDNNA